MFSMGMSYRDIYKYIEDMYGMNVATGMISSVTDKLIPELKAWQQRQLDRHYQGKRVISEQVFSKFSNKMIDLKLII
jgi:hypothetical protein